MRIELLINCVSILKVKLITRENDSQAGSSACHVVNLGTELSARTLSNSGRTAHLGLGFAAAKRNHLREERKNLTQGKVS